MSPRDTFLDLVRKAQTDEALLDLCRLRVLHGLPFVFAGREDEFYAFRRRIAVKFRISFHEVYITGSAKLGFSLMRDSEFTFDSDIDVAIVSHQLFSETMADICRYQMELRESRRSVTNREMVTYHKFLEYTTIGWMRPDLLPVSFAVGPRKQDWFKFFESLSYGQSEVGNYKVNAGVFRYYEDLERYQFSGMKRLRQAIDMPAQGVE